MLLEAGWLRELCSEAISASCPSCGSPFELASGDSSEKECWVCPWKGPPIYQCAKCSHPCESSSGAERECQSVSAFESRAFVALQPEGEVWFHKKSASGKIRCTIEADLLDALHSGELKPSTLVCNLGADSFEKANEHSKFSGILAPPEPPPTPTPTPTPTSASIGKKIFATFLAFIFGPIGLLYFSWRVSIIVLLCHVAACAMLGWPEWAVLGFWHFLSGIVALRSKISVPSLPTSRSIKLLKIIGKTGYILLASIYYLSAWGSSSDTKNNVNKSNPEYSLEKQQPSAVVSESSTPLSLVQENRNKEKPLPTGTATPPPSPSPSPYQSSGVTLKMPSPTPRREIPPSRPLPQSQAVANPVLTDIPDKVSKSVNASEVMSFQKALDLADRGDARAQAIVSIYYQVGYKTRKDISKASEYALRSAKQHNPLGMYRLAVMMESGEGFEKNVEHGKKLKELAFEGLNSMKNDPYALTAIGIMLFRGEGGLTQDRSEAVRLYKKAADMGYAPAQYNYSAALALGQGIAKDESESLKWWQRAYDQDYPPAMSGPVGQVNSKPKQTERQTTSRNESPKPSVNKRLPRGIPVSGRPGFVFSPYAPGAGLVDARGVKSGETLTCPFTRQLFLMP